MFTRLLDMIHISWYRLPFFVKFVAVSVMATFISSLTVVYVIEHIDRENDGEGALNEVLSLIEWTKKRVLSDPLYDVLPDYQVHVSLTGYLGQGKVAVILHNRQGESKDIIKLANVNIIMERAAKMLIHENKNKLFRADVFRKLGDESVVLLYMETGELLNEELVVRRIATPVEKPLTGALPDIMTAYYLTRLSERGE